VDTHKKNIAGATGARDYELKEKEGEVSMVVLWSYLKPGRNSSARGERWEIPPDQRGGE